MAKIDFDVCNHTALFHTVTIERLKGVGAKTAQLLSQKGIRTIEDLLYFCPISYEDRRTLTTIEQAEEDTRCNFVGRVVSSGPVYYRHSHKKGFQALFEDNTGSISLTWFNFSRSHLERLCRTPYDLFVSGQVTRFGSRLQVIHPHIAEVKEGVLADQCAMVPTYSEVQGVSQPMIRKLMKEVFHWVESSWSHGLVPPRLENGHHLPPLLQALKLVHFPDQLADGDVLKAAHTRLILEEFLSFQTALFLRRKQAAVQEKKRPSRPGKLVGLFLKSLPFELTNSQKRVIQEIEGDMRHGAPMNRLLQGDVGCGKTLCAIFAACLAIDNGFQVALLAPTEILAEQHYLSVQAFLGRVGVRTALLTASVVSERSRVLNGLKHGEIPFMVGTHALIEDDVRFSRLGLVIIDEQHKFGVLQRKAVIDKAAVPNVLAVTATPIPRTLSAFFYGDLDVSTIDEMPPGRCRVETTVRDIGEKSEVYRFVLDEVARRGQAYLVFPFIEEDGEEGIAGVIDQFEHLANGLFKGHTAAVLHGRMALTERDEVMRRFKQGEIQILLCTTVIEVGLDQPNATVVVIHNAERFGLAQLHQMRGRVGRGAKQSFCVLLADQGATDIAKERLRIMEETSDGFRIAEADMKLRGPGEMLGVRQSGLPKFRVGDVIEDATVMSTARELAYKVLPELEEEELAAVKKVVFDRWGENLGLSNV